ncbi:MAG: hypothetical protein WBC95_12725 [Albidovulum sp.]
MSAVQMKARRKSGKTRRPGRGALFLIAMLLGSSGVIRLGAGAGHALAKNEDPQMDTAEVAPESCAPDGGALVMLEELRVRSDRLASREAQIQDRAQALTLAKAEIDEKIAALIAAEEKLAGTLTLADAAADKDVSQLVAVYEKMKPKDAALLFGEMDPEFAAGFLARMKADTAAQVMAGLDPKAAYTISVLLAGRNANAPRN